MQRIDERSLVATTKPGLVILPTPELNAETPAHLLDDDITPTTRLFARNTGAMPVFTAGQTAAWTLAVDGCVHEPRSWTLDALRRDFQPVTQIAVLECAGNGRAFFKERAGTVLWHHGAVGCVQWTGVRLGDVLQHCRLRPQAVYTGHHSPDRYLDDSGPAISRGLPIAKALAPETMIAFELNGEPLPALHGGPLRIVAPGYPGSAYQKWLTRIEVRDCEHDGERMRRGHYRLPRTPLHYGEHYDNSTFAIITDMPVRSLITSPADGFAARAGEPLIVRGHAWSGHVPLEKIELSLDGGRTWQQATLGPLPDRFAWRRFEATLAPPAGEVEIIARAADRQGGTQPLDSVPWNPGGYCNNLCHRVQGRIGG